MDPIRKIPKKFTKKFGNKVINRQYFRRKTGLEVSQIQYIKIRLDQPYKSIVASPELSRTGTYITT